MKPLSRAEVILHPQRLAVLRALATRSQTTKELLGALPALPQATLYRHLALLLEAGVIEVIAERQVRGTSERTYGLARGSVVSAQELAEADGEDHFRYFASFLAGLLGEYGHYLQRPDIDLERDGVGYREHVLQLSDEELLEMLTELRQVLHARTGNSPRPDRTPRLFATVSMPLERSAGEAP